MAETPVTTLSSVLLRLADRVHRVQDLEDTLIGIMEMHARPDQPGASCREGCAGRWPCSTWAEANQALHRPVERDITAGFDRGPSTHGDEEIARQRDQ